MRVWCGLIGERYSYIIAFRRRSRTAGERVRGKLCPLGMQSLAGEGLGARGQAYFQDLRVCITNRRKYINECDVCLVHLSRLPTYPPPSQDNLVNAHRRLQNEQGTLEKGRTLYSFLSFVRSPSSMGAPKSGLTLCCLLLHFSWSVYSSHVYLFWFLCPLPVCWLSSIALEAVFFHPDHVYSIFQILHFKIIFFPFSHGSWSHDRFVYPKFWLLVDYLGFEG